MEVGGDGLQSEKDACHGDVKRGKTPRVPPQKHYLWLLKDQYEVEDFILIISESDAENFIFQVAFQILQPPIRQTPSVWNR